MPLHLILRSRSAAPISLRSKADRLPSLSGGRYPSLDTPCGQGIRPLVSIGDQRPNYIVLGMKKQRIQVTLEHGQANSICS